MSACISPSQHKDSGFIRWMNVTAIQFDFAQCPGADSRTGGTEFWIFLVSAWFRSAPPLMWLLKTHRASLALLDTGHELSEGKSYSDYLGVT